MSKWQQIIYAVNFLMVIAIAYQMGHTDGRWAGWQQGWEDQKAIRMDDLHRYDAELGRSINMLRDRIEQLEQKQPQQLAGWDEA